MAAADVTGNLLNIAEISAAFAGFAALVSVLRQRGTRADAIHDILRLRIVISTSMVVVVAALIPVGLTSFQLSERMVWGLSAGILLLLNYGVIYSFIKSYKPVEGRFPPEKPIPAVPVLPSCSNVKKQENCHETNHQRHAGRR